MTALSRRLVFAFSIAASGVVLDLPADAQLVGGRSAFDAHPGLEFVQFGDFWGDRRSSNRNNFFDPFWGDRRSFRPNNSYDPYNLSAAATAGVRINQAAGAAQDGNTAGRDCSGHWQFVGRVAGVWA